MKYAAQLSGLVEIQRYGPNIIAPWKAELLARIFGETLDSIGLSPTPVMKLADRFATYQESAVRVSAEHKEKRGIATQDLAARLALKKGCYFTIDHAMQRPALQGPKYVTERACVRLARMYGGDDMVKALRERAQGIDKQHFVERPQVAY